MIPQHASGPGRAHLLQKSIVLLALSAANCFSLLQPARAATYPLAWRWSNPLSHGADISEVAQANQFGVQVGERGQLFTSTDFSCWTARDSHTDHFLRGATFLGGRLVVCGERGTILFSEDPTEFYQVDLGTSDWLESVAASTNLVVAVGDNGAIYTSADALSWARKTVSFTTWLRGVARGPSGFVAVGENGFVASSPTGNTWTPRSSGVTAHLNRVAWLDGRYWAVGDGGTVITSTNGSQWAPQLAGATNFLYCAAGTPTNSFVVAGEKEVRLRELTGWTNELRAAKLLPPPSWSYYASLWDGASYWLGGAAGMWVQGAKTNATTEIAWSIPTPSVRQWLWALTRTPSFYLAVGDHGTILASDNGIDWDLDLVPASVTNTVFLGTAGSSSRCFAVGNAGAIVHSTNGVTWQAVEPRPTTNDLQGVAALGELFVAAGARGTLLTSADGSAWTRRSSPTTNFLSSLAAFPGGLVAAGDNGTLLTSSDGLTWSSRSRPTTNWFYQVRYLNGTLVVVGENGTLLTSVNGTDWTARSTGTSEWLTDATFLDATWFAVGTRGTLLASTNLMAWTNVGSATRNTLFGVAVSGGQLLAVGVQGIILRSQLVPDLSPIHVVSFARTSGYNLFLFSGRPAQRFLLERSPDLAGWLPSVELELTDGSGTLLFLQQSDSALVKEFFRARAIP